MLEFLFWSFVILGIAGIICYKLKPEWFDIIIKRFKK